MPVLAVLPLDDRPVTYDLPARVGAIARAEVSLPPRELLGNLTRPADREALGRWLLEVGPEVDALVVALDTLAYGGLIPSRRSPDELATIVEALSPLRQLKEAHPRLPLHAFSVTMRLSDSDVNEEEKAYWDRHGKAIYRWSFHQHRFKAHNDPQDQAIAREARATIPDDVLEDYLATRERNFSLNQTMVKWAGAGFFDTLLLTQDDTSSFGLNVEEQQHLLQMVNTTLIQDRVLIYPGADEVAAVLVARALNRLAGRTPAFAVSWHPLDGKRIQAMYEDRPLWQTLRGQIRAAGGKEVGDPAAADLEIVVNAPASGQGDLALGLHLEAPDTPSRNLEPVIMALEEAPRRPVAFADVAYANGADPRLWPLLVGRVDPWALRAFAGWNTAGNTFGTVVAAASAGLLPGADEAARAPFITERVADDWLYQGVLRAELRASQAAGASLPALEAELGKGLAAAWAARFPARPTGFDTGLPWQRLFEARTAPQA
ncbi:MAG: DUF4127 family protein [Candidatus Sericytochromatia bacterium]|nr:DUF4127 family protein [Candidatus Sericytochromatia bacterium]